MIYIWQNKNMTLFNLEFFKDTVLKWKQWAYHELRGINAASEASQRQACHHTPAFLHHSSTKKSCFLGQILKQ